MAVSLKQRLIGGFTGAALAAGSALTALPATAQDAGQQPQVAAVPTAPVSTLNARGFSYEFLRMTAALESKDAIVLVFYGMNRDAYEKVKHGAERAKASGLPVKGILFTKGYQDLVASSNLYQSEKERIAASGASNDRVEIYADGNVYATSEKMDMDVMSLQTAQTIVDAYREWVAPKRQQARAEATPAAIPN